MTLAAPATHAPTARRSGIIPDQYIVVLKDTVNDVSAIAREMAATHGLKVGKRFGKALKGFSATIPATRLDKVKQDPRVLFVSEDRTVQATGQVIPTGFSRINAQLNSVNKGTGVGVAVLDTGIDVDHPDVAANLVAQKNCIGDLPQDDGNGHGTHVAGTIAALNNSVGVVGIAPEAKLMAVKVLDDSGTGSFSSVICGVDWVTANTARYNIKVANMSLEGGGTNDNNCGNTNADAFHKAICQSTSAGVTYVVAAGNGGSNAANTIPASYDDTVITASALADSDGQRGGFGSATWAGADDTFASFSNYGAAVDLGAPGVDIYSTSSNGGYARMSGTSMASPHVAAAAALYIQDHPGSTWQQVRDGLIAASEARGAGHTDPSGLHPERVVRAAAPVNQVMLPLVVVNNSAPSNSLR